MARLRRQWKAIEHAPFQWLASSCPLMEHFWSQAHDTNESATGSDDWRSNLDKLVALCDAPLLLGDNTVVLPRSRSVRLWAAPGLLGELGGHLHDGTDTNTVVCIDSGSLFVYASTPVGGNRKAEFGGSNGSGKFRTIGRSSCSAICAMASRFRCLSGTTISGSSICSPAPV